MCHDCDPVKIDKKAAPYQNKPSYTEKCHQTIKSGTKGGHLEEIGKKPQAKKGA